MTDSVIYTADHASSAEALAWQETARQYARNSDYHRDQQNWAQAILRRALASSTAHADWCATESGKRQNLDFVDGSWCICWRSEAERFMGPDEDS